MTIEERLVTLLRAGDIGSAYLACSIMKDWEVRDVERTFDLASTSPDPRVGLLQISERMIKTNYKDPFLIIKKDEWVLLHNQDNHIFLMGYGERIIGNWRMECEAKGRLLYL